MRSVTFTSTMLKYSKKPYLTGLLCLWISYIQTYVIAIAVSIGTKNQLLSTDK